MGSKKKLCWRVLPNHTYYIVQSSTLEDVSDLCDLENEFIEDHRTMLLDHGLSNEDLHAEVGVNADHRIRKKIIEKITQPGKKKELAGSGRQDFTLKCVKYPGQYFSGESKTEPEPEVVGYVYFKLKAGQHELGTTVQTLEEAQAKSASSSSSGMMLGKKVPDAVNKLVISHLKVSKQHQGNACAKLLLAGMLKFVEDLQLDAILGGLQRPEHLRLKQLQLSVVECNERAIALYRTLGFEKAYEYKQKCKWVTMKYHLNDCDVHDIAEEWINLPESKEMQRQDPSSTRKKVIIEAQQKSEKRPDSSKIKDDKKDLKVKIKRQKTQ